MNVFELLKADHRKVSSIFEQIEQSDAPARQTLFTQLKQELDLHAHVEETLFYPRLKEAAETRDIIIEAYDEHQEVKDLLAELAALSPDDDDEWSDLLEELKDSVEHHVEEEENEMFPQAREVLTQQEIDELGTQIQAAKQQKPATATTTM